MPTPGASHNRKAGSQIPCARRDRDNKADLGRPMDTHGSAAQPSLVQRNPPRPDSSPAPARTSSATRRTAGDPDPAELDQQSLGTLDRDPHSGSGRGRVNPRPSWTGSPSCRGPSRARASTATSSRGFVCSPTRGRFRAGLSWSQPAIRSDRSLPACCAAISHGRNFQVGLAAHRPRAPAGGERWPAVLESVSGATPQEFESLILRNADLRKRDRRRVRLVSMSRFGSVFGHETDRQQDQGVHTGKACALAFWAGAGRSATFSNAPASRFCWSAG